MGGGAIFAGYIFNVYEAMQVDNMLVPKLVTADRVCIQSTNIKLCERKTCC